MKLKTLTMTAAVAALMAGGAVAQDTQPSEMTTGDTMSAPEMQPAFISIEEMTVGDVIGTVTYDPDGNRIAEIDYVIAGTDGPAAVLGIGGFLGLGEYTVAVPLDEFTLREDGRTFELGTSKEALEALPEFDESNAESLPDDLVIGSLMPDDDATLPDDADTGVEDDTGDGDTGEGDMGDEGDAGDGESK